MNYMYFGCIGLKVSCFCFGIMNFGDVIDEKISVSILDEVFEVGINFIDIVDVYGIE